jgi:hypothetical protein
MTWSVTGACYAPSRRPANDDNANLWTEWATRQEPVMRLSQLEDVLFPVEEHPVYVVVQEESGARRLAARDKKAIVDIASHRILGIVSRDYRLVTNREALEWAYECCRSVFPDTDGAEWDVSATDGPSTGGYCRIDLVHRTAALNFGDVRPGNRPEAFGPFIRVTNSYNGLRALAFDIGFYRKVCRNGLIAPDTIVHFKFAHRRNLGIGIHFEVARNRLAKLQTKMSEQFVSLKTCRVPRTSFEPMVRTALMIRPMKSTRPGTREANEWASLNAQIHELCNRYALELGETGYAVLNAITDFASHPPPNRHLHRDRHALQRLAGTWLTTFAHECAQPGFAIDPPGVKIETSLQAAGGLVT